MKTFLLDTNVLLALALPEHVGYAAARQWFDRHPRAAWATCPTTQSGLVRNLCNPAVHAPGLSLSAAMDILADYLADSDHHFWAEDIPVAEVIEPFRTRLRGHRQITDAYLLGLAHRNGGQLVTLDRGIRYLLPPDFSNPKLIVEIGA